MASTVSEHWNRLTNPLKKLPIFVRRVHRIVAALWILSIALGIAFPSVVGELPGPSIPGLSFIALIITGSYLLLRPWVRGPSSASDRWNRLTNWDVARAVLIRRSHRVVATLWLLFLGLALGVQSATGSEPELLLIPVVALLLYLAITGTYMLLRPWVNRFRSG